MLDIQILQSRMNLQKKDRFITLEGIKKKTDTDNQTFREQTLCLYLCLDYMLMSCLYANFQCTTPVIFNDEMQGYYS